MQRVIAYVDGFNLYYGLKSQGWRRFYWLDIPQLVRTILRPGQSLVDTKYFTSRIAFPHDKQQRQEAFLQALQSLSNTSLFFGHYLHTKRQCPKCGAVWTCPGEKMTDVNIAVELIVDAHQDNFDLAVLISGDSDLAGPVQSLARLFPQKRLLIAFPPNRISNRLKGIGFPYLTIGRRNLAKSQLPASIKTLSGHVILRLAQWQ